MDKLSKLINELEQNVERLETEYNMQIEAAQSRMEMSKKLHAKMVNVIGKGDNDTALELNEEILKNEEALRQGQDKAGEAFNRLEDARAILESERQYRKEISEASQEILELTQKLREIDEIMQELSQPNLSEDRRKILLSRLDNIEVILEDGYRTGDKYGDVAMALTLAGEKLNRARGIVSEETLNFDQNRLNELEEYIKQFDDEYKENKKDIDDIDRAEELVRQINEKYARYQEFSNHFHIAADGTRVYEPGYGPDEFDRLTSELLDLLGNNKDIEQKFSLSKSAFEIGEDFNKNVPNAIKIDVDTLNGNLQNLKNYRSTLQKQQEDIERRKSVFEAERDGIRSKYKMEKRETDVRKAVEREKEKHLKYRKNEEPWQKAENTIKDANQDKNSDKATDQTMNTNKDQKNQTEAGKDKDGKNQSANDKDKSKNDQPVNNNKTKPADLPKNDGKGQPSKLSDAMPVLNQDNNKIPETSTQPKKEETKLPAEKKPSFFERLFGQKEEKVKSTELDCESVSMPKDIDMFLLENENKMYVKDGKLSFFEKKGDKLIRKEKDIDSYIKNPSKALDKAIGNLRGKMLEMYGEDGLKKLCKEMKKENGGKDTDFTRMMSSNPAKRVWGRFKTKTKDELDGKLDLSSDAIKTWDDPTIPENQFKMAIALDSALTAQDVCNALKSPYGPYKHSCDARLVATGKTTFGYAKLQKYEETELEKMNKKPYIPTFECAFDENGKFSVNFKSRAIENTQNQEKLEIEQTKRTRSYVRPEQPKPTKRIKESTFDVKKDGHEIKDGRKYVRQQYKDIYEKAHKQDNDKDER